MAKHGIPGGPCLLFVDYENVQTLDLAALPGDWRVRVFVGSAQKSISITTVLAAQALGPRLEWVRSVDGGPNALDFIIAYSLGAELARSPATPCVVLSKDRGYDALLSYLKAQGHTCRRVNSQLELAPPAAAANVPDLKRITDSLVKAGKARPQKKETLAKHIANVLQKPFNGPEVQTLIDILFRDGLVSETAGRLSYSL